jgi:hypothetical protein
MPLATRGGVVAGTPKVSPREAEARRCVAGTAAALTYLRLSPPTF